MALIIEDGTVVAGANSYATLEEFRTYGSARGLEITTDDTLAEQQLIRAMDYLLGYEDDYQGARVSTSQELSFPRYPVYIYGADQSNNIPVSLKNGQCRIAFDAANGDLVTNGEGKEVIEEQVGSLKTKFNPDGSSNPQPVLTEALKILEPLFKEGSTASGGSISILVDR